MCKDLYSYLLSCEYSDTPPPICSYNSKTFCLAFPPSEPRTCVIADFCMCLKIVTVYQFLVSCMHRLFSHMCVLRCMSIYLDYSSHCTVQKIDAPIVVGEFSHFILTHFILLYLLFSTLWMASVLCEQRYPSSYYHLLNNKFFPWIFGYVN